MEKGDLAGALADKSHLSKEEAERFISVFAEVLADYFHKKEKVVIAELGSFFVGQDGSVQFNPSSKLKELAD